MDTMNYHYSGIGHGVSSYIDSLALNPKFHSLSSFLKKLKSSDPQLRLNAQQMAKLESLLKAVNESMSALNNSNFSVTYDAFIKFYKTINISHNLLHRQNKSLITAAEEKAQQSEQEIESLQEKVREIDDLKQQITELKSKLAVANQQISNNTDEIAKQVIQDISKQLHFSTKTSDVPSLVKTFRLAIQKSNSYIKTISKEFNLPSKTNKDTIIQELKNSLDTKLQALKETIQSKEDENIEIQKRIAELNDRVEELKIEAMSEVNFSKDPNIKSLQKTIANQKKRIRQLEKELQDPNRNKEEMESLLALYEDLSAQYRSQSDEILEAINSRTTLIMAVEKQNQIIAALEKQLEKSRSQVHIKPTNIKEVKQNTTSKLDGAENQKIEKAILEILDRIPIEKPKIDEIIKSDSTILQKIQMTFAQLTDYAFDNQQLSNTNQKLFAVISGQFKFISHLSNSKEFFQSLYPDQPFEECRSLMISQIGRIQNFINTYAKGLSEDACLFDDLLKTQTSQDFLANVKKYLSEYTKPQTLESEELFILLLQSIACNDILRKYADESRKHNVTLVQKYKAMRETSDRAKKALELQSTTMIQESNIKLQDQLEHVKSLLRKSIIADQTQNTEMIDCLEELDTVAAVKDTEYIKALQKQNNDLRKEVGELKTEKSKLFEETKTDIITAQSQISKVKDELTEKINQKSEQNTRLITKLKQASKLIDSLKQKNNKLSSDLEESKTSQKELEEQSKINQKLLEEQSASFLSQYEQQLALVKADFEKILTDAKNQCIQIEESKNQELAKCQETQETLLKTNQALTENLKEEKEKVHELSSALSNLKDNETEALNAAAEISKTFSDLHADYEKLEFDYQSLKAKFDAKNDKMKREKAILESQMNSKIRSIEHDAQTQIEAGKLAQSAKQQLLLGEICKYFPDYENIPSPITEESVYKMLQTMRNKIDENSKNEKNLEILQEAAKLLQVDDYNSIPQAISSVYNDRNMHKSVLDEYDMDKSKSLSSQEWIIRLYSIITNGICISCNPSLYVMQQSIEDAVLSSLGNNKVSQRLEILKAEKRLLLMKVQDVRSNPKQLCFRHIMIVIMYTMRLKKRSGNLENNKYSFATKLPNDDSENDITFITPRSPFSTLIFES